MAGRPKVVERRLHDSTAQLPNDIVIWEHQRFENPPALATREGRAYSDLRLWVTQFYPTGYGAMLLRDEPESGAVSMVGHPEAAQAP